MLLAEDGNYVQSLLLREAAVALDATFRDSITTSIISPFRRLTLPLTPPIFSPLEPLLGPLRPLTLPFTLPLDLARASLELSQVHMHIHYVHVHIPRESVSRAVPGGHTYAHMHTCTYTHAHTHA